MKAESKLKWIWIIGMSLLIMVNVARAGGEKPTLTEKTQNVFVELNKVAIAIKDKYEDFQYCLDPYVPLDDFKIEIKMNYIGVTWTF